MLLWPFPLQHSVWQHTQVNISFKEYLDNIDFQLLSIRRNSVYFQSRWSVCQFIRKNNVIHYMIMNNVTQFQKF